MYELITKQCPLRYQISDWHQLPEARSNNSDKLHLHVSDLVQNNRLQGVQIRLEHDDFGCLFACVLGAVGHLITEYVDDLPIELSPNQILRELEKYGYYITYKPAEHLPSGQLEYLITLLHLGYDRIRVLNTYTYKNGTQTYQHYVVVFNVEKLGDWLNNAYTPNLKEMEEAVKNGYAINISEISKTKRWSWSWLDFVGDIEDILEDNACP